MSKFLLHYLVYGEYTQWIRRCPVGIRAYHDVVMSMPQLIDFDLILRGRTYTGYDAFILDEVLERIETDTDLSIS